MKDDPQKPIPAQRAQSKGKVRGARTRRITEVMPEVRGRIRAWFDRGMPVERIADEIDVPAVLILEHVVREHVGARHPGPFGVERRPAQRAESIDGTPSVREFKVMRGTA